MFAHVTKSALYIISCRLKKGVLSIISSDVLFLKEGGGWAATWNFEDKKRIGRP